MQSRWHLVALCGLLLLAVGLVFGQTGRYGFVNLDDEPCVWANPVTTRGVTPETIAVAFTDRHACAWVPLVWISHMADVGLYGTKDAGGHHLTNVVLHGAAAVLLFSGVLLVDRPDLAERDGGGSCSPSIRCGPNRSPG